MKDAKSIILAILILLVILCGLYGAWEIIKGLISEFFDLLRNIFA